MSEKMRVPEGAPTQHLESFTSCTGIAERNQARGESRSNSKSKVLISACGIYVTGWEEVN